MSALGQAARSLCRFRQSVTSLSAPQRRVQPMVARMCTTTTTTTASSSSSSSSSAGGGPAIEYEEVSQVKSWQLGHLNHVAIAVPNLEEATSLYRNVFGARVSKPIPLPEHGVTTVFVHLGNTKIELLEPLGKDSPIESFLKKKPEGGIHHVCIEVDDILKAIADVKDRVRPLNQEPKIGAHGRPVVFLHPKDCGGVLLELEEK